MTQSRTRSEAFVFPSGVTLRIQSSQREVLAHFREEYRHGAAEADGPADVEVYAGKEAIAASSDPYLLERGFGGRHKILRWRVGIAGIDESTTRIAFEGGGQMVISFLQTFYAEPLLRLKFASRGYALVHAACVARDGGSVLFPAGSAVGKSTLTLQHAAEGYPVQGDNYVILAPDGRTLAFPRRMRIYSDLKRTAPQVFGKLPAAEQRRLRAAGIIKRLSAGYSNQPRRLTVQQMLPNSPNCPEAKLRAVFLLKPYTGQGLSDPRACPAGEAIRRIQEIGALEAKYLRKALEGSTHPVPASNIDQMLTREREVLEQGLRDIPVHEILVPRVEDPAPVVAQIRRIAGLAG
jgi:hypothetical protein